MPEAAKAFAQRWLVEYGDRLYSYALGRVGGDTALAEDLVQETLLAGLRGYEHFEMQSAVETWLIGILKRKIADHYRNQARRSPEFSLDEFFTDKGSIKHLSDWSFEADRLLENREFLAAVQGCMRSLNPQLAEAFVARVIDGLSSQEACKLLGITPTNLSVRLHRARLALRRCLEIKWFEGEK